MGRRKAGEMGSGIEVGMGGSPLDPDEAAEKMAELAPDGGIPIIGGGERVLSPRDKKLGPTYKCIVINMMAPQSVTREVVAVGDGSFQFEKHFLTNTEIELPKAAIDVLDGDATVVKNERVIQASSGFYEAGPRMFDQLAAFNPNERPKVNDHGQIVMTSGYRRFMVKILHRVA